MPNSGTSHHQDIVRVIRGISSQEDKCFCSLSFNISPILSRLPVRKNKFFDFIPIRNGIETINSFHTHHHGVIKHTYGTREQTAPQSPETESEQQDSDTLRNSTSTRYFKLSTKNQVSKSSANLGLPSFYPRP